MPKAKRPESVRIRSLVEEFGENVLFCDNGELKCKPCNTKLRSVKKCNIIAHFKTNKHKSNVASCSDRNEEDENYPNVRPSTAQFYLDLCFALVSANIPIWKIENDAFKSFLEKYTGFVVPSESTIRKAYVGKHYHSTLDRIRSVVGDKNIWLSVDECTDCTGRQIANAIIGTMEIDKESNIFLLNCEQLDKTNSVTIAQFIESSLCLLWPDGIKFDNILLLVTDAASYMKKTASSLRILYPNMIHLTCLAHGLHRIAEEVRAQFKDIDELISNGKKIFLKCPRRCEIFRELAPDVPLPPQPVVTRWGTWLTAAMYYAKHLPAIQNVIESFNPDDATSIKIVQELLKEQSTQHNLLYISANFSSLADSIKKLEERNLEMVKSLEIFHSALRNISVAYGEVGKRINAKAEQVVTNNPGLKTIENLRGIIVGQEVNMERKFAQNAVYFKYGPLTSVEVERSFSKLTMLLSDQRLSLKTENVRKLLIISSNY